MVNIKRIKELRKVLHDAQTKMDLISKRIMQGGLSLDQQILHLDWKLISLSQEFF